MEKTQSKLTEESFLKIISHMKQRNEEYKKFSDLGIDIFETALLNTFDVVEHELFCAALSESQRDYLMWWIYETNFGTNRRIKDGKPYTYILHGKNLYVKENEKKVYKQLMKL